MFFNTIRISAILLIGISSFSSYALSNIDKQMFYYDVGLGGGFTQSGNVQTLTLLPPFQNAYHPCSKDNGLFLGELFIGMHQAFFYDTDMIVGLSLAMTNTFKEQGIVEQSLVAGFDNLEYSFKINHAQIAFQSRLFTTIAGYFEPYFIWSVGAARNKATDYNETPRLFPAVAPTPFTDNTVTSFTYRLGIGLQIPLYRRFLTSIAYTFSDLGQVKLGESPAQATQETLYFPHLYAHLISLHISY